MFDKHRAVYRYKLSTVYVTYTVLFNDQKQLLNKYIYIYIYIYQSATVCTVYYVKY